jgi:hypothetical protein
MSTVTHSNLNASPVAGACYACPPGCGLPDMIRCWSPNVRELRTDLRVAKARLAEPPALAPSEWRAA